MHVYAETWLQCLVNTSIKCRISVEHLKRHKIQLTAKIVVVAVRAHFSLSTNTILHFPLFLLFFHLAMQMANLKYLNTVKRLPPAFPFSLNPLVAWIFISEGFFQEKKPCSHFAILLTRLNPLICQVLKARRQHCEYSFFLLQKVTIKYYLATKCNLVEITFLSNIKNKTIISFFFIWQSISPLILLSPT